MSERPFVCGGPVDSLMNHEAIVNQARDLLRDTNRQSRTKAHTNVSVDGEERKCKGPAYIYIRSWSLRATVTTMTGLRLLPSLNLYASKHSFYEHESAVVCLFGN